MHSRHLTPFGLLKFKKGEGKGWAGPGRLPCSPRGLVSIVPKATSLTGSSVYKKDLVRLGRAARSGGPVGQRGRAAWSGGLSVGRRGRAAKTHVAKCLHLPAPTHEFTPSYIGAPGITKDNYRKDCSVFTVIDL